MACEILSCAVPKILDALVSRSGAMHLDTLFSLVSPRLRAATALRCGWKSSSSTGGGGGMPPPSYLLGYWCKVVGIVAKRRPAALVTYLDHTPGIGAGLVAHLDNAAVSALLGSLLDLPFHGPSQPGGMGSLHLSQYDITQPLPSSHEGSGAASSSQSPFESARGGGGSGTLTSMLLGVMAHGLDACAPTAPAVSSTAAAVAATRGSRVPAAADNCSTAAAAAAAASASQNAADVLVAAIALARSATPHAKYAAEGYNDVSRARRDHHDDDRQDATVVMMQELSIRAAAAPAPIAAAITLNTVMGMAHEDACVVTHTELDASYHDTGAVRVTDGVHLRLLKSMRDGDTADELLALCRRATGLLRLESGGGSAGDGNSCGGGGAGRPTAAAALVSDGTASLAAAVAAPLSTPLPMYAHAAAEAPLRVLAAVIEAAALTARHACVYGFSSAASAATSAPSEPHTQTHGGGGVPLILRLLTVSDTLDAMTSHLTDVSAAAGSLVAAAAAAAASSSSATSSSVAGVTATGHYHTRSASGSSSSSSSAYSSSSSSASATTTSSGGGGSISSPLNGDPAGGSGAAATTHSSSSSSAKAVGVAGLSSGVGGVSGGILTPSLPGAPRLGTGGLALTRALCALSRCSGWPDIGAAIVRAGLFSALLDTMMAFAWHSILHRSVTDAVVDALVSGSDAARRSLLFDSRLLSRVVAGCRLAAMPTSVSGGPAAAAAAASVPSSLPSLTRPNAPPRVGYTGHLVSIANTLLSLWAAAQTDGDAAAAVAAVAPAGSSSSSSGGGSSVTMSSCGPRRLAPALQSLLASHSDWWAFVDAELACYNVAHGVLIGGMAPDVKKSGNIGAAADATGGPKGGAVDEVAAMEAREEGDSNGSDSDDDDDNDAQDDDDGGRRLPYDSNRANDEGIGGGSDDDEEEAGGAAAHESAAAAAAARTGSRTRAEDEDARAVFQFESDSTTLMPQWPPAGAASSAASSAPSAPSASSRVAAYLSGPKRSDDDESDADDDDDDDDDDGSSGGGGDAEGASRSIGAQQLGDDEEDSAGDLWGQKVDFDESGGFSETTADTEASRPPASSSAPTFDADFDAFG